MIPGKALLVAVPIALAGVWVVHASHHKVIAARAELLRLGAQAESEREAYVRTLQGTHAERQLDLLSQRRAAALELAAARRDRLLGLVLLVAAAVAFFGVRAAQRIAAELDEGRSAIAAHPAPEPRSGA